MDIAFYFLIHLADVRCDLDPTPEARAQQTHCLKCVIGHYVPLPEGCEDLVAAAIGERTRDALRHKRGSGERVGNIRFGFRLSPDGKHVEPDPGEQGMLTEIGHLRQSEHTLRGIAVALNRQALRTRRGSAWRLEHVARIIKQATSPR